MACLTNLMTNDEENVIDALKSAYKYFCIARSAGVEDAEQQIISTLIECESYIKQIPDIDHAHEMEMAMPFVRAGSADAGIEQYNESWEDFRAKGYLSVLSL